MFRKQVNESGLSLPFLARPGRAGKACPYGAKSIRRGRRGNDTSPVPVAPGLGHGHLVGVRAQIVRTILKVYDETGIWPIEVATDCLYYETSGPDPEKNNPAPGVLKYDDTETKLGHFKADFIGTMAEFAEKRNMKAPGKGGK